MKRLLSVLLSLSLLCNLAQISEAKTNYKKKNEAVICKSNNGEKIWIRGESLPPINIVANANSTSTATSTSKSESNSKSSSGGSSKIETGLKLLLLGVVLWYVIKFKNWLRNNPLTNGVKKVFSVPGEIMNGLGSLWTGAYAGASKIFSGFSFGREGHGDEDHKELLEGSGENTTESNNGDSSSVVKNFLSVSGILGIILSSFSLGFSPK